MGTARTNGRCRTSHMIPQSQILIAQAHYIKNSMLRTEKNERKLIRISHYWSNQAATRTETGARVELISLRRADRRTLDGVLTLGDSQAYVINSCAPADVIADD